MTCQLSMSLGVYVLGAADDAERRQMEAHLPGCPACRAELARLAPLPSLLANVPDDMLAPSPPPGLGAGRPPRRTASAPWRAVAVAACLAAAVGAAAGYYLAPRDAGGPVATMTLSGVNRAAHVSATAALTAAPWGSDIQLSMRGVPLKVECRLIVHSRYGGTEVAGTWYDWGDGPIRIPASAGWQPAEIASLQVVTATGDLVTISAGKEQTGG